MTKEYTESSEVIREYQIGYKLSDSQLKQDKQSN